MKTPNPVKKYAAHKITSQQPGYALCRSILATLLGCALLNLTVTVIAAPVTIPDFSFENTPIAPGGATAAPNVGTNWAASGNSGVFIQDITNTFFTPTGLGNLPPTGDGTNYLVENINGHTAYCWQNVGLLQSNTIYTVTIAVGQSLLGITGVGEIALVNGATPFGTILAATPVDNSTVTADSFADSTLSFTNGYQTGGFLTVLMQGNTGSQLLFDNVRLDATPTPQAPLALLPKLSTPATVYQGTLVTVSENPAGALPFRYQWQTDNGTGGATFSNISGATNINVVVDTSGFTPNSPVEYIVIVTNSFGASTSAPVSITAITGQPVVVTDTLPATGSSDVVGSAVTFTATFDGSRPITYQWLVDNGGGPMPIDGATNTTLTLTNLQLTDTASYSLQASNSLGTASSTASSFTVNPVPTDVNGIIASPANQVGFGGNTLFTPTWVLATNSLIGGASPTLSVGNFQLESSGGIPPLTDGKYGQLPPEGNASPDLATCGTVASGAGSTLAYTLPAFTTGWDITNIVVYGGWSDGGRDQQRYQIYFSTTANPTNYNNLIADVNFDPTLGTSTSQQASRVILTATNGALAKNIAGVKFFFNTLASAPENGYEGYAEFQVFGAHSAPAPVLAQNIRPATGSDVEGSQVTLSASFTSSTPIGYQWTKDGAAISGATNTSLTITNLQLTDTATSPGYVLVASNASGTVSSGPCSFVVNSAPGPDGNGVIDSPANQTGNGATFSPTWTVAPGSLIAGMLPSAATYNGASFNNEGSGGLPVLTDGQFGSVGSSVNTTMATCGSGNNSGHSVTYTLTGSAGGFNVSNIVVYAGWSDGGRDQQAYTIYYTTIDAPTTFKVLTSFSYNPTLPGAVPSADRVTYSSSTNGPLANNVSALKLDFTSPGGENGYSGYAEFSVYGAPAAIPSGMAPVVKQNTLPAAGSDVVGSQVTFTASFNGEAPITYQWQKGGVDIGGATGTSLTLTNLQLSDSGSYSLVASNANGTATNTPNTFTVNPVPPPTNGIIASPANQISYNNGFGFTPTWTVASGSLIAGQAPFAVGSGNFRIEACAGVNFLTDGGPGVFGAGNASLASCGTSGGTSVTYALTGSAGGYDLNRIVVYAGWADSGRDGQGYRISYSTVTNPTTFIQLTTNSYNPTSIPAGTPTADRLTIKSSTAAPLAKNVARMTFTFLNVENGWSGYGEMQVFGTPSTPLTITSTTIAGGNLILRSSGGTPGGGYTWLTTTNVSLPVSAWTTSATGIFDGSGNSSNAFPIIPSDSNRFFRLRTP